MGYSIDRLAYDTGLPRHSLKRALKNAEHLSGGDGEAAMALLLDRLDVCEEMVRAGTPFERAWAVTNFASGAKRARIVANAKKGSTKATSGVKRLGRWLRK